MCYTENHKQKRERVCSLIDKLIREGPVVNKRVQQKRPGHTRTRCPRVEIESMKYDDYPKIGQRRYRDCCNRVDLRRKRFLSCKEVVRPPTAIPILRQQQQLFLPSLCSYFWFVCHPLPVINIQAVRLGYGKVHVTRPYRKLGCLTMMGFGG